MAEQKDNGRILAKKPSMMRPSNNYALSLPERSLRELDAMIATGVQGRSAVFELTAVNLGERDFGLFSGFTRFLEQFAGLRFDTDALNFIESLVSEETLNYLQTFSFTGMISAYPEGEAFFEGSPVVSVEAPLGQCLVLEGLLSASITTASSVATSVGHLRRRLRAQKLYELWGSYPESTGATAAYSAHLAGADATDSVLAARMHAHVPMYDLPGRELVGALLGDELAAFNAIYAQSPQNALPLDFMNLQESVEHAIAAGNRAPFAVSLPLVGGITELLASVREQLDTAESPGTNIALRVEDPSLLTDELIDSISSTQVQVDLLAVNFAALTAQHPPVVFRYELVEVENPETGTFNKVVGTLGRKIPFREFGAAWDISREILLVDPKAKFSAEWRRLHVPYVAHGKIVTVPDPRAARELARENLTLMPSKLVPVVVLPEQIESEEEADLEEEEQTGTLTRRMLNR